MRHVRVAELGTVELFLDRGEPDQQLVSVRQHEPDHTAQHQRFAGRQMELAATDIDPHVLNAGHQIGIARQPQPRDI